MNKIWIVLIIGLLFLARSAEALQVEVYSTAGRNLGTVKVDDTIYGVLLTPDLRYLPPGFHGFHIDEDGRHYDPDDTHMHRGPYDRGHLGDLPVLIVYGNGRARLPVLAPRLKLAFITGKTLVIDAGGDNYRDVPYPLGGGGPAIACGTIPYH